MTPAELSVAFFLQMAVIVAACRASGWVMKRVFDQPQVIGEMIAGIILGPSLLGLLAPDLQHHLFPKETKSVLFIGALMNARGLMELIIINIGLQKGIIGPALFSMLVVMALVTTLMTSPLFEQVYGKQARARGELGALNEDEDDELVPAGAKA